MTHLRRTQPSPAGNEGRSEPREARSAQSAGATRARTRPLFVLSRPDFDGLERPFVQEAEMTWPSPPDVSLHSHRAALRLLVSAARRTPTGQVMARAAILGSARVSATFPLRLRGLLRASRVCHSHFEILRAVSQVARLGYGGRLSGSLSGCKLHACPPQCYPCRPPLRCWTSMGQNFECTVGSARLS